MLESWQTSIREVEATVSAATKAMEPTVIFVVAGSWARLSSLSTCLCSVYKHMGSQ